MYPLGLLTIYIIRATGENDSISDAISKKIARNVTKAATTLNTNIIKSKARLWALLFIKCLNENFIDFIGPVLYKLINGVTYINAKLVNTKKINKAINPIKMILVVGVLFEKNPNIMVAHKTIQTKR